MQEQLSITSLVVPLSAVGGVLFVGAIYGRMNTRIEEAHSRIDKQEQAQAKRDSALDQKLDDIHEMLMDLRLLMASHNKHDHNHKQEG